MYNVIENKFVFFKKSFIGTKYEKDNDDFFKKCFQNIVVEMY
jgi:hypothetical protein